MTNKTFSHAKVAGIISEWGKSGGDEQLGAEGYWRHLLNEPRGYIYIEPRCVRLLRNHVKNCIAKHDAKVGNFTNDERAFLKGLFDEYIDYLDHNPDAEETKILDGIYEKLHGKKLPPFPSEEE